MTDPDRETDAADSLHKLLASESPPKVQSCEDHEILDMFYQFLDTYGCDCATRITRESECIEFTSDDDDGKHYEIVVRRIDERSSET